MPAGATPLDADESAGLLPGHIATREQLDEWEAENILEGQRWAAGAARRRDVLDDAFLRELHRRMFRRTWKWASAYRSTEKNLGRGSHIGASALMPLDHPPGHPPGCAASAAMPWNQPRSRASSPLSMSFSRSSAPPTSTPFTNTMGKVGQPVHILSALRRRHSPK